MRLWIIILTTLALLTQIVNDTDLIGGISLNPLGNKGEPLLYSENEDFSREAIIYQNENVPIWTTINYGSINEIKTMSTDINGVDVINIGDAAGLKDMVQNAEMESKVSPIPLGGTIYKLPGVQKNGVVENEFVFSPASGSSILAPRNYYYNSEKIIEKLEGDTNSSLMTHISSAKINNLSVFKVPFGAEYMLTEATGITENFTDIQKTAKAVDAALNKLSEVAKTKTTSAQLTPIFFKDSKLTTEFSNINNLINSGKYADHYREGLRSGFGTNDQNQQMYKATAIRVSGQGNNQNIFTQFDFIYNSLKSGSNPYYSAELNKWGKDNADSIIHTLIANYYLQVQFKSSIGGYNTPISMSVWKEKKLSFYKDLLKKGIESKEPFYLYMTISPKADTGSSGVPVLNNEHIVPDLSYIYGLYTGIHSVVWSGMDSLGLSGSSSTVWDKAMKQMNDKINEKKVTISSAPTDSNEVDDSYSLYDTNLITGLSTAKGSIVYPNKELVGALRVLLSKGENTGASNSLKLNGITYKITEIDNTKYSKVVDSSYLFKEFKKTSGSTSDRWITMVTKANKVPIHPAIFKSPWEVNSEHAYIMMPIMMGGIDFPTSLSETISEMMKPAGSDKEIKNMSGANMYVIALNFKENTSSKSSNSLGTVEVNTESPMGTALDKTKPITLLGYNGAHSFSIIDYFKVQDYISEKRDKSPISVKTTGGTYVTLKYFNLFNDFFTIKEDTKFIGAGTGQLKYDTNLDKESYVTKYKENKSKSYINQLSPNYESFFKYGEDKTKEESEK